jgi:hypothetical protein
LAHWIHGREVDREQTLPETGSLNLHVFVKRHHIGTLIWICHH